jgi:hypothetical protein
MDDPIIKKELLLTHRLPYKILPDFATSLHFQTILFTEQGHQPCVQPLIWSISISYGGIAQTVAGFPLQRPGFESESRQVGFMVDKVALEQVSSGYFGFPFNHSTDRSTLIIIRGWYSRPNTADVPSGFKSRSTPRN